MPVPIQFLPQFSWFPNLLFLIFFQSNWSDAQPTIRVSRTHLIGPCGDTIQLKGINYAPYNWGWSSGELNIAELAKTKANCVRLAWYNQGQAGSPSITYSNLDLLDSALSQSVRNGLIPILTLHDLTCQNSPAALIQLANWFVQPTLQPILSKYSHSLILNLANEALYVNWASNPVDAKASFISTYTSILTLLRNAGIKVPLMIDAPDCGTNLDVLTQVGPTLIQNDPDSNLVFSAHAYWYSYANNDSTIMLNKIQSAIQSGIPFIFGELANWQDDATFCQYALTYRPLLRMCKQKKISWLAWSWDHDGCSARQMSISGNFNSLSSYGQDLVFNSAYGLLADTVAKSRYLSHPDCQLTSVVNPMKMSVFKIFQHENSYLFSASGLAGQSIQIFDALGRPVSAQMTESDGRCQFQMMTPASGWYWIRGTSGASHRFLVHSK